VYRARDEKLNRDVAIKVLPVAFSQDRDRLRRFEQEAQAAGALNHPNILAVYDVGTHDGSPCIVAELLEGEELRVQLNNGRFNSRKSVGYLEIWLIPIEGGHTPQTLVQGPFNAGGARFSPDGRWVAYVSDESGRNEVYVRPYPQAGTHVQISADGGSQPVWSRNGRELFFRHGDDLIAVNVSLAANFTAGKPLIVFSRFTPEDSSGPAYDLMADYDVSADGQRFVMPNYKVDASNIPNARVILSWFDEIKRRTTGAAAQ